MDLRNHSRKAKEVFAESRMKLGHDLMKALFFVLLIAPLALFMKNGITFKNLLSFINSPNFFFFAALFVFTAYMSDKIQKSALETYNELYPDNEDSD